MNTVRPVLWLTTALAGLLSGCAPHSTTPAGERCLERVHAQESAPRPSPRAPRILLASLLPDDTTPRWQPGDSLLDLGEVDAHSKPFTYDEGEFTLRQDRDALADRGSQESLWRLVPHLEPATTRLGAHARLVLAAREASFFYLHAEYRDVSVRARDRLLREVLRPEAPAAERRVARWLTLSTVADRDVARAWLDEILCGEWPEARRQPSGDAFPPVWRGDPGSLLVFEHVLQSRMRLENRALRGDLALAAVAAYVDSLDDDSVDDLPWATALAWSSGRIPAGLSVPRAAVWHTRAQWSHAASAVPVRWVVQIARRLGPEQPEEEPSLRWLGGWLASLQDRSTRVTESLLRLRERCAQQSDDTSPAWALIVTPGTKDEGQPRFALTPDDATRTRCLRERAAGFLEGEWNVRATVRK